MIPNTQCSGKGKIVETVKKWLPGNRELEGEKE